MTEDQLMAEILSGKRKPLHIQGGIRNGDFRNHDEQDRFLKLHEAKLNVALYAAKVDALKSNIARWSRNRIEFKRMECSDISRNLS